MIRSFRRPTLRSLLPLALLLAAPGARANCVLYQGLYANRALVNLVGPYVCLGAHSNQVFVSFEDGVIYRWSDGTGPGEDGPTRSKPVANRAYGGFVYSGAKTNRVLVHLDGNVVYRGAYENEAIVSLENHVLYSGAYANPRAAIANTEGCSRDDEELFLILEAIDVL